MCCCCSCCCRESPHYIVVCGAATCNVNKIIETIRRRFVLCGCMQRSLCAKNYSTASFHLHRVLHGRWCSLLCFNRCGHLTSSTIQTRFVNLLHVVRVRLKRVPMNVRCVCQHLSRAFYLFCSSLRTPSRVACAHRPSEQTQQQKRTHSDRILV